MLRRSKVYRCSKRVIMHPDYEQAAREALTETDPGERADALGVIAPTIGQDLALVELARIMMDRLQG